MKFEILHSQSNRRLILIYGGWSTTPELYSHIRKPGWDVAVVTGIDAENIEEVRLQIKEYSTVYLFAWSLGVFASEHLFAALDAPAAAFAINGTARPADDRAGIPEAIFNGTREGLTSRTLAKFRRRMFSSSEEFAKVEPLLDATPDIEVLKSQLLFAQTSPAPRTIRWNKAFIGSDDKIFPADSQSFFWKEENVAMRMLSKPHYVDLQEIIDLCIVNTANISRSFTRSSSTYNSNAVAQKMIALRLADSLRLSLMRSQRNAVVDSLNPSTEGELFDDMRLKVDRFLEIGCGNGLLTHALSRFLDADKALFLDLCECGPFNIAKTEDYFVCDAETWVADCASTGSEVFDMICSSSAIQWFSDIPLFLANCSRILRKDGLLAMATFTAGNLAELDALRDSSLRYLSEDDLKSALKPHFGKLQIWSDTIVLEFDNVAQLLRHLKLTGVTATAGSKLTPSRLRNLDSSLQKNDAGKFTLTFRPLYFIAADPLATMGKTI